MSDGKPPIFLNDCLSYLLKKHLSDRKEVIVRQGHFDLRKKKNEKVSV